MIWLLSVWIVATSAPHLAAQPAGAEPVAEAEAPEAEAPEAEALYTDAANFQRNDAFGLAAEAWERFLDRFPDHRLAGKAAYYLGVSQMRRDPPDLGAAAEAFTRSLQDRESELREESLANLGWCLYASGVSGREDGGESDGTPPAIDEAGRRRLGESIRVWRQLREEFPQSRLLDRAYFYEAEAAYAMGDLRQAVASYEKFRDWDGAANSPLRCDAFYGWGVALEGLNRDGDALSAFGELLDACPDGELANDARLRSGDLWLSGGNPERASKLFETVAETAEDEGDRAYALFRQAYAMVRQERLGEATARYELLLERYPASPYVTDARMATAQIAYRVGDTELAADRFEKLLAADDVAVATEATHWLARIWIGRGEIDRAREATGRRWESGVSGEFAMAVKLDLAETLAMRGETLSESADRYEQAYRESPQDRLAPRALYNAAFSALQAGQPARADTLASEFLERFPGDDLAADCQFIVAEARLAGGDAGPAADGYAALLGREDIAEHPQRARWALRAARAFHAAGRHPDTIALLTEGLASEDFGEAAQRAEAHFLLGQAYRDGGRHAAAAKAFASVRQADERWAGVDQALLLEADSLVASGDTSGAAESWRRLITRSPETPLADRARYRLAQSLADEQRWDEAFRLYEQVVTADREPSLVPYARYGQGWIRMRQGRLGEAVEAFDRVLPAIADGHPIRNETLLARGTGRRDGGDLEGARQDLEALLASSPADSLRMAGLFELAITRRRAGDPRGAAEHLARLRDDFPDDPSRDRTRYELGWAFREAGETESAGEEFAALVREHPDSPLVAEAAYAAARLAYEGESWERSAEFFEIAAGRSEESRIVKQSLHRLGWARYKLGRYEQAEAAFREQTRRFPEGTLALDGWMMIGESAFRGDRFDVALEAFGEGRRRIRDADDRAATLSTDAERRVREVILLHGGQSAAQLGDFADALAWYGELRERFPATAYLAQAFYETGFAHQQAGDEEQALRFFAEVANNYRNEVAARARFMMGEIRFGRQEYDQAIAEFQRVMFGFGAQQAPESVKRWQAKSGWEAARCAESWMGEANNENARRRARDLSIKFYGYVIENHPQHELAEASRERIAALEKP